MGAVNQPTVVLLVVGGDASHARGRRLLGGITEGQIEIRILGDGIVGANGDLILENGREQRMEIVTFSEDAQASA